MINTLYLILELKNVRAGRTAFGQICSYMGWVEERISDGRPVIGIVVSRGTDSKFDSACRVTDCVHQIELADLGVSVILIRQRLSAKVFSQSPG